MSYNKTFEKIAILFFWLLLIASIFMLFYFYICDNQKCKPFDIASNNAEPGTKDFVIALLTEFGQDGMWPFPYIGAAILTPLSLWFMGIPITLINFGILFFTSFVVIYFLFSFYGHHYIRFINDYTENFIRDSCSDSFDSSKLNIDENSVCTVDSQDNNSTENTFNIIPSYDDNINVTFSTPINIF